MEVNIFYSDHLLVDDYKLIDVAYIFGWDQVNPMMLSYSILQLHPNASVVQYTSAVTTQRRAEKSGTKPFQVSTASTTISRSSQRSISAATVAAYSSSPGGKAKLATVSSSNADTSTADKCSAVDAAQCHSTSEGAVRKRGRKRKKSQHCSSSPSPVKKRFCVRDDGPGIRKTFLSVKDRDGMEQSLSVESVLTVQNPQSSGASCIDMSVAFAMEGTKGNVVQNHNPLYSNASTMVISDDQVSVKVNACGSMNTNVSQSHIASKDAVLDHQNCVLFNGANDTAVSAEVNTNIIGSDDRAELALGLVNGTDFEGKVVGGKDTSSAENDAMLEPSNTNKVASNRENELISGLSSVSHVSDSSSKSASPNLDSINAVSSTIETKTVVDTTNSGGSETTPAALERDETQFLEADSSMLPVTPCTSGIYGQPNCSQMASERCETDAGEGFGGRQTDAVLCPQCGRKAGFVDGTSVTSTSSSIRCRNCLSFNTSITVFINHGQERITPEFSRSQYEEPQERTRVPEIPKVHINDPGGGGGGEDFRADLIPKVECLDDRELSLSTGLSCDRRNHWDATGPQLQHPPSLSMSSVAGRHCQPPANSVDPSGLQTKTACHSGHQSTVPSNGSPSPLFHPSTSDSSPAVAGSAAAVTARAGSSSTDRCPAVSAVVSVPLTGIKCGRKQKSLESIIRQLQPRQMSPATAGADSLRLSPKAPTSPPLNRKPVVQETPLRTTPSNKEPFVVEGRLTLKAVAEEGQGQSWSTENQSLLRRTLTGSGRNHQATTTGRFPIPEVRLSAAPPSDLSPYCLAAPPIKKLKNMFEGLESAGYPNRLNGPLSRGENRRLPQFVPTTLTPATGIRAAGVNCLPSHPEAAFQDNHTYGMTRRYPTLAVTSANGFDAPLELTTKESRDRKRRETAKKSDGEVLRTSFPLIDNRR